METAFEQPHPYLLNRAGGISRVKEFSLINGQLTVVPEAEKPLTGMYHLIYRCASQPHADIKRAVSSDGKTWTVTEPLIADENYDVCYPKPCN